MKYNKKTSSLSKFIALVTILFASVPTVFAQSEERALLPFAVTVIASTNYNLHNTDFSIIQGFGGYGDNFSSGSGIGMTVGGGAEYFPKSRLFGMSYRIGGLLLFSTYSGELVKQDFIGNVIQGNSANKALVETSVSASISALLAEPYLAFYPLENAPFSIKLGLQVGIPLSAKMNRREELIAPEGVNFETGSRVRNDKTGDIPGKASYLLAGLVGIRYDMELSPSITLTPEASFGYALTDISSSLPWKAHAFRVGANVIYRLPEPLPEAPPPPPREQRLEIATFLQVNGVTRKDGETINVPVKESRRITRQTAAPVIFFAPNSDVIPTPSSQNPSLRSQQSVIAAVAAYLRANPTDKLTITTYFADDESSEVASRRAIAIIEALRREKADFGNITTVTGEIPAKLRRPELRSEFRRAVFSVNGSPNVFSTVETQLVVEGDDMTIAASSDFNATELPVTVGGTIEFEGKEVQRLGQAPANYVLRLSELTNTSAPKQLVARYDITDVTGSTKSSAIQVQFQPVTAIANETVNADPQAKYEQHILGYFDFDAATFAAVDTFSVERAKQAIREEKKLEIIGLTDDIGTEEYNSNLAYQRIAAGMALLQTSPNQVTTTLIAQVFPNDGTPASRVLNRSVVVRIR